MYKRRYRKNAKYFYFGLLTAAAAVVTLVVSVYETITGESVPVQATGYLSFLMWSVSAFMSFKVYFDAKRADEERLEDINDRT
ncbi:MAG: hypothetical protein K2H90_02030 [Oscillospiraceae bacterium]|nr:hypothetical protein [Oscillospiraceae bacterium]